MNAPKISIVTPSYNQANFLEETIQSVLNQGYENLEYVIVDGGSDDSSVEIIKKYEDRLSYWVSEKDNGHGHAINKGFSETSGEIMAWINSDDMYTPWSLHTVAEIFTKFPHVDWIVGFYSFWNRHGAMTHAARVPKNIFDYLLGNYEWIQQESVFWRRSLWEKAGGCIDESQNFMVDGELWSRFFQYAELYSVDCILGGYRYHSDNRATHNQQECIKEMELAISELKANCSSDLLLRCYQLKILRILNKLLFCKSKAFGKLVSILFKDVRYKNIHFKDDFWVERTLPFNLR